MATPREHIEQIRRKTFYIGEKDIPEAHQMLDQAVKYLSAELYAKDVHFLMELIQNAEDNEYLEGLDPSLEFVITSRDITATGAPATLLLFNNEKGFSPQNIKSICSLGNSTKKGNRKRGYIGEKGIGFKSVFLISAQPYIFSNGYQIRFNEKPCPHCNLGYIVPEWVDENPSLSDIKEIYGANSVLPTTTIVLPLKPDKVKPVKQQLSNIHPEVLLFLSKIKHLSVREDHENPALSTVNSISIFKETDFLTRKNIDAESYTLHLSAEGNDNKCDDSCSLETYYVWKQRFPVKPENRIEKREDVEEWVITLAFPDGNRNQRTEAPGVYAFLPTEMATNFPFIIQADFVLASSRETILLDNIWNQGILDCVPVAFVNALVSLVKTTEDAPLSIVPQMFKFLPVNQSSYPQLNVVRESIKARLGKENIIPSESYTGQNFFHKPCEMGRIVPRFWNILKRARKQGISLYNLSSHGKFILNSAFDRSEYDPILNFLGVGSVNNEWYAKCIQGSNLITRVSEETYLELLLFLADNWSIFSNTSMRNILLVKYVGRDGSVSLCSISSTEINGKLVLCRSNHLDRISWLIDWNKEFLCFEHFFLPKPTQVAIGICSRQEVLLKWLQHHLNVKILSVNDYAVQLVNHIFGTHQFVIACAHFLYGSLYHNYLSEKEVKSLCQNMPLLDSYGNIIRRRNGALVPASKSKWAELIFSNLWSRESYVELSEDYSFPASFAGQTTMGADLLEFLETYLPAFDIPRIPPPDAEIPAVAGPLTKKNVFLLLGWIRHQRYLGTHIPVIFLNSIKNGNWLRVNLNGSPGYRPPSQSFLLTSNRKNSNWGDILQNGSVLVDIPLVDQDFYGDEIIQFREELMIVGVMFEYEEACKFIGNHLKSLASSSAMTRSNVISILNFIRFLRQNLLPPEDFILRIKEGKWLRTTHGYRSPVETAVYDKEWAVAAQISEIPFISEDYYGTEIHSFKEELGLLGVVVGFNKSYQMVIDNLKSPWCLSSLTAEALLLILDCIHYSTSSDRLVESLKTVKCLKTNSGYKSPGDCLLVDTEWGCLLQVFNNFPILDRNFYGSIGSRKEELKQLGVKVDFEEAVKMFVPAFRKQASSSSIRRDNVFAFLSCYRQLKCSSYKFPADLKKCIKEVNWLRSRLGDYRCPKDCILFGPDWESISPITLLPFIDDSDNCLGKGIHEYGKELKGMGVVTDFKDGARLIATCLHFPYDPCQITPVNVFSLLKCISILLEQKDYSFPASFQKNISREWLKTSAGYRSPKKCFLFDSKWGSILKHTDGPFIDEEFYGSDISSYRTELSNLGVIVDPDKACSLLASHLESHSDFDIIVRIYEFLWEHRWIPESEESCRIWIPNGTKDGKWVEPGECVREDKDGLFGVMLNVLDRYYQPPLLEFFVSVLDVKCKPSVYDYCEIWKVWGRSEYRPSQKECYAFWSCIVKNWSSKLESYLASNLLKLPTCSGSGEIFLCNRFDVFIADDLQLKELFEGLSSRPLFIWYPLKSLASLRRSKLLEIYMNIGVRLVSESVQKEELSLTDGAELKQVNPMDSLIGKGLVSLIIGFLADPSLNMEAKQRHETVECLINLTVLETVEPINTSYSLKLSSGESLKVKGSTMIRWDKTISKFFMQKLDKSAGQKALIEYATNFAQVVAKGVLWQKENFVASLSELIKMAFLLDFNEEAIQFLMKSKNLQIFLEDEEFLSASFPLSS